MPSKDGSINVEDAARALGAEVQPLFATAPLPGDPLPLLPRGPRC